MARTILVVLLLVATAWGTPAASNQKKLTNDDIVRLVKANVGSDIIVQTIRSNEQAFDLSADSVILLKDSGVPESIIHEMLVRTQTSPQISQSVLEAEIQATEDALSYLGATLIVDASRTSMKYTTSTVRTSTGFRAMGGSMKARDALNGKHALLRLSSTTPTFEVRVPANAQARDIISLVRLTVKSDRREIETVSVGYGGVRSSYPQKWTVGMSIEELPRSKDLTSRYFSTCRLTPNTALEPGEYALAMYGRYYDFGVDGTQ
jgi:hypothetical protein